MTGEPAPELWRKLVKLFPAVSLPLDMFVSPSTWRLLGTDLTPSVVRNVRARKAAAVLAGAAPETVATLTEMARLNASRTGDIFRTVAVGYISLPITLAALVSEAAPDVLRTMVTNNLNSVVYWVFVFGLTPIFYFCGMWRAKQLQWAIEYFNAGVIEPWPEKKRRERA